MSWDLYRIFMTSRWISTWWSCIVGLSYITCGYGVAGASTQCTSYGEGGPPGLCHRNCGSSAVSGSWIPGKDIRKDVDGGVYTGIKHSTGSGEGPETFTVDLLNSDQARNLSELIAKVRCDRDEDMPLACRLKRGRWLFSNFSIN